MSSLEIKQELHKIIDKSDSPFIEKIYRLVLEFQKITQEENIVKPFSKEVLLQRANQSNDDYNSGKITTQE